MTKNFVDVKEDDYSLYSDINSKTISHFKNVPGVDILKRGDDFYSWVTTQKTNRTWLFYKSTIKAPLSICEGNDECGRTLSGINFASQDYLSLAAHPSIKKAAIDAISEYGVHSAGSPSAFGRSTYYHALCHKLSKFLGINHVILYPTGWSAGYGVITGLVRKTDYIIMDLFSHNCLQEGAFAATKNVYLTPHLDNESIERKLKDLRTRKADVGILVITESLFSMDSDVPNLNELQKICQTYSATLLIDCAHDFGCLGKKGLGNIEVQGLVDKSNVLLIGSGSKVLATNLGYVACNSECTIEYLKIFSAPLVFSNALLPMQASVALQALTIIASKEGEWRRTKLMENINYLRNKLLAHNFLVLGEPSPLIVILIGEEKLTRLLVSLLLEDQVIVHHAEYPAVSLKKARIRLQIMADHHKDQLDELVKKLIKASKKANELLFLPN